MLRGEVWWVDFDPSLGGEIQKTRPAVIVSNDASNRTLNRVQVVQITSNFSRVYPCEAAIDFEGRGAKSHGRLERAIRLQLGLGGGRWAGSLIFK
jgi:mRNA interferase MazF